MDGTSSLLIIFLHEVLEEVFVGISNRLHRLLLRLRLDMRVVFGHLGTQMTDDGLHNPDGDIGLRRLRK